MPDNQLFYLCIQSDLCSLCSCRVISFFCPCLFRLCKSSFMEQQIHIVDLFHYRRTKNCIGTISVFACRGRRTGQTLIGNNFSFGSNKIRSVLNTVQFVNRNFIKIHHFSDDMIRTLLLLKQESATGNSMFKRDRSYSHRTVIINLCRFFRLKFVKKHFIGQCLTKKS